MTSALPSRLTATTWRSIQLQNHSRPSCQRGDSGIPRPVSRTFGSDIGISSLRRAAPAAGRLLVSYTNASPADRHGFRLRGIAACPRQVLYLLPGEAEPDAVVEPGHLVERDGDVLARPQMPFPDQHVGHLAAARVDAQGVDLPDVAVGGMDVVTAALFHLARRDDIELFNLRTPTAASAPHAL